MSTRRGYRGGMRWESLFADMEAQLEAAGSQERAAAVAELTRAERATVTLADRLRASDGEPVTLHVRGGASVTGRVEDVGPAWVLVLEGHREHLVPLAAVVAASGPARTVAPGPGPGLRRLGIGHALRAIARDRTVVRVATSAGVWTARLDAVGADHVDVGVVDEETWRPRGAVQVVTFGGLDLVSAV